MCGMKPMYKNTDEHVGIKRNWKIWQEQVGAMVRTCFEDRWGWCPKEDAEFDMEGQQILWLPWKLGIRQVEEEFKGIGLQKTDALEHDGETVSKLVHGKSEVNPLTTFNRDKNRLKLE